ncbi:MAG: hypothetical protein JNK48_11550 [Bryobacterales bacterium]|nr:hypothetical protein [Bryobacterales bacterium]
MGAWWRNRTLVFQCLLTVGSLALVGVQFRTLNRLEAAERALARAGLQTPPPSTFEVRPQYMDRIFSFPTNTCGPAPLPVFPDKQSKPATPKGSVSTLAREQYQYGILLSAFLITGLFLGAGLTYRTAYRESKLAQMKSAFVSNVSHEMKTPLATIQMYAETLESGRVRDEKKLADYHRVIYSESQRLGQLIEDVLDFARMESQAIQFHFQPVNVIEMLEEVSYPFRRQVELAGGRLHVDLPETLPLLQLDRKAIEQAVGNLLSNALKYSPERKEITLRAGWEKGQVAISVEDEGIGIAEEDQQRIFDKFYRANHGLAHNTKGAGLGLAIAGRIVKAHKGRIAVWSEPGRGSRFTILLPWANHGETAETADRRG